ncbi:RNA-binding S4 domain-containing protein [Streptococcus acidominimus]|uniref:RNA-binding S4 domain-containing protein n=1 Tax=Streptococcus acidominimus TaxID=1326 RepID=A0A4Y9FQW8_STRAI|nr:RNA-binding S4 domain-containing protein [Streptococcus acidominimus]MBF0818110.1 RNA-binding S4 domain-containing protein [Streptococcus acidominimus]MBF0838660.1 RNA-binding S4 domain-containing protein [Streptococcus acidominimus]MBF0848348.1 RNA-binding S4 domain-containing protein [Streptococcus danieliae]TFU31627.1 RNA-binding S4 domain-containing protein [Streptococcus acidominimus]
MDYKLYDDHIILQALLKEVGLIQSGGAIKGFLQEYPVFFNGEKEERRRKKIRIGDVVSIPSHEVTITMVAPTAAEQEEYERDRAEKERVAQLVKQLNAQHKKGNNTPPTKTSKNRQKKAPVRFPGT